MKVSGKFLTPILSAVLLLSLAACSGEETFNITTQIESNAATETTVSDAEATVPNVETADLTAEIAAAPTLTTLIEPPVTYPDYDDNSPLMSDIDRSVGDYMIFSSVTAGGYIARIVLADIVHTPDEELNAYSAIGRSQIELVDAREGHPMTSGIYTTLINPVITSQSSSGIWADCAENGLQIYEFKFNGNTKYLLRAYISYGKENGAYPDADPDLYSARFYICDGDVCAGSGGTIVPYTIKRDVNGTVYTQSLEGNINLSDSLVYKGENVFYDEKQNMEIAFDPVCGAATYRMDVSKSE